MNKRKIKKTIKKVLRTQQDPDALEEALFVLRNGLILGSGVRSWISND